MVNGFEIQCYFANKLQSLKRKQDNFHYFFRISDKDLIVFISKDNGYEYVLRTPLDLSVDQRCQFEDDLIKTIVLNEENT